MGHVLRQNLPRAAGPRAERKATLSSWGFRSGQGCGGEQCVFHKGENTSKRRQTPRHCLRRSTAHHTPRGNAMAGWEGEGEEGREPEHGRRAVGLQTGGCPPTAHRPVRSCVPWSAHPHIPRSSHASSNSGPAPGHRSPPTAQGGGLTGAVTELLVGVQ